MTDAHSPEPTGNVSGVTQPDLFVRNATGLVRAVSPRASLMINYMAGNPILILGPDFSSRLDFSPEAVFISACYLSFR